MKAIILAAHMFNKKRFKKPSSGCSIYKTSSNNGIGTESEFFLHQNEAKFQKPKPSKILKFQTIILCHQPTLICHLMHFILIQVVNFGFLVHLLLLRNALPLFSTRYRQRYHTFIGNFYHFQHTNFLVHNQMPYCVSYHTF